jgi:hypothetical protein
MSDVQNASSSETLHDALTRVGNQDDINLLNEHALSLTKGEVSSFLSDKMDLSDETKSSLLKFAKRRIIEGKRVFPWEKMEDIELNESNDSLAAGTW